MITVEITRLRFVNHPQVRDAARGSRGSLRDLFKDGLSGVQDRFDEMKDQMVECLVNKMGLETENGTLDIEQAVLKSTNLDGPDKEAVVNVKIFFEECAANTTSTNATQQMLEIMSCVKNKSQEFCDERHELLRSWIETDSENATCSSVTISSDTIDTIKQYPSQETSTSSEEDTPRPSRGRGGGRRRGGRGGRGRGRGGRGRRSIDEDDIWPMILCVNEEFGSYNASTGFNFTAIADRIATFSGWEDIPEALANLTQKMIECQPEFEGDAVAQGVEWMTCLRPSYMEICGPRSPLTEYLFPGITKMLKHVLRHDHFGMSVEDDDDDDVLVDAGLLDSLRLYGESDDVVMIDDSVEVMTEGDDPEVMLGQMKRAKRRQQRGRNSSQESNESQPGDDDTAEVDDSDQLTTTEASATVVP
ncbi:uncharacterized protein LOC122265112 [Penaeus japonicus]|uniref:uncharacterized protein LOC122265112 n=1 Tax=Penaeus japonicus TaxID=27405 RepID=UPI001C71560C|nr:uncharacterized protein LOC122265112 [Penaeus japonicus]